MLRQLLYSTGGGILSNKHKAEQAECVTLAIGLGGTGVDCLRNLKRQVYEAVKPDNPDDPDPIYSHIKFLAVDSDRSSMRDDGMVNQLDERREFFDISSPRIPQVADLFKRIAERPEYQWLNEEIQYRVSSNQRKLETDGTRQIGRLLLMMKSDAFAGRVVSLITDAKRGLPAEVDINVHIFSGLCGGTGSGIFLDVCYLVQEVLSNYRNNRTAVFGYFFLPDANLSNPSIRAFQKSCRKLSQNGYAAMKELDYCMNFETNGGEWNQQYRGIHTGPTKNPPVHVCHLISSKTMIGVQMPNGYGCAMNAVSDYVMQFLIKTELDMQTHMANCCSALQQVQVDHGTNYRYIALGASNAVVPAREILTYLGGTLFKAFPDNKSKYPTAEEVEQIARENSLDFEGLMRLFTEMPDIEKSIPPFEERMYRGMFTDSDQGLKNTLDLPDEINEPFLIKRKRMLAEAEKNISALMYDWRQDKTPKGEINRSVIRKAFLALEEVVADPARGPFYAAAVLNGTKGKNLVNILAESLETTERKIQVLSGEMPSRIDDVKMARAEYLHPRFLQNRQRLFNTLWERIDKCFEQDLKIAMLERMRVMIPRMIDQFNELFVRHFEPYCKIYSELLDTSAENSFAMRNGTMDLSDPFTIRIPELNFQMIRLLDKTLGYMDIDKEDSRFNRAFFNAEEVWATGEESKIVKFVSDYVSGVFDEYFSKTIEGYLEMQFDTTDTSVLEDMTFKDILEPLSPKARPLFWINRFYDPNSCKSDLVFIPDTSVIIHKAMVIHSDGNPFLHLVKSSSPYRIYRLNCLFGVPMFAYCGTDMYKEIYRDEESFKGFHIYEGTGKESRDWRKLPDLVPLSVTDKPSEEMLKNEEMYKRAVDTGIIRMREPALYGLGQYELVEYELVEYEETEELREIENLAERAIDRHDGGAASNLLRRTEDYLRYREPARSICIPNNGAYGCEEIVRKDYVVGNPAMVEAIKRQIDILEKIHRIRSSLEPLAEEEMLMRDYCNALFTGVIDYSRYCVTCTVESAGMTKEIELSGPFTGTTSLSRFAPLYQGFVSYMELEESEREYSRRKAEERLCDPDTYAEQIKCACDSLEILLRDDFMEEMQDRLDRFPDKASEIMKFYKNLRETYLDFRRYEVP